MQKSEKMQFSPHTSKKERRQIEAYLKQKEKAKKKQEKKKRNQKSRKYNQNKKKAIKYSKELMAGTKPELILKKVLDEDGMIMAFNLNEIKPSTTESLIRLLVKKVKETFK